MKAEVSVIYYYERDDESGELYQVGFLDEDEVQRFLDLYGDSVEIFDIRSEMREINEITGMVII